MKKNYLGLFLFFLISNLTLIAINIPLYNVAKNTPSGTFSPLVHKGVEDYYLYLSVIREGKEGAWLTPALYTSEPTQRSILYIYFILVGKFAAILRLSPYTAYHLARIISVELMILGIYLVVRNFFRQEKFSKVRWLVFAGAFFALFSTVVNFNLYLGKYKEGIKPWPLVDVDPVGRLDYLPHQAFGTALLFFTVYFLMKYLASKTKKGLIVTIIFSFLTAIFYPPAALPLVIGLGISVLIQLSIGVLAMTTAKFVSLLNLFIISAAAGLGLLIMRRQIFKGFPWSQWSAWDMGLWNSLGGINEMIVTGGGWALLLAIPMIIKFLFERKSFAFIFLSIWAVLPYALLPFTNLLGISRIRVVAMGNFLPLGILAVMTLQTIYKKIINKSAQKLFIAFLILGYFVLLFPVSYSFYQQKTANLPFGFSNINVPLSMIESFNFLGGFAHKYSVVLSEYSLGNMLPAFTGLKVYHGHVSQTKEASLKRQLVTRFYSGQMKTDEARQFIKDGNIRYIYFGPLEKTLGQDFYKYGLSMVEIYNKAGIIIYKIK